MTCADRKDDDAACILSRYDLNDAKHLHVTGRYNTMSEWYYLENEQAIGPFSPQELLDLVRQQIVVTTTMVRKDQSAWFPAFEVGGLFDAAVKPTVTYHCPECGTKVLKPPTYCRKCRRALDYARPIFTEHEVPGYEKADKDKATLSDSWKQWIRRVRVQRNQRGSSDE